MTTFQHEAIAAIPVSGQKNAAGIRAMNTRRMAYCLDISEDSRNFIAVDPDAGTVPLYIIQNNISFRYDSTDTTTAWDGITCLVTNDGKRYKAASLALPDAVLSRTVTAPPGSPTLGDAYVVPVAATGAWAGKDNQVTIFTSSSWQYLTYPIGRLLFIEDVTSYYHRNVGGTWVIGTGTLTLGSNSVTVNNIIGKPVRWNVVNQTTNTPPGSPAVGDAYIIGSSPTGAWAGNAAKIAICEAGTTFTIYTPRVGESAFDVANVLEFFWSGTIWKGQIGSIVGTKVASGSIVGFSRGSAGVEDTASAITYTARKTGAVLRFEYRARLNVADFGSGSWDEVPIGLYRDLETTNIDGTAFACSNPGSNTVSAHAVASFEIASNDALSHVYTVKLFNTLNLGWTTGIVGSNRMRVYEFS